MINPKSKASPALRTWVICILLFVGTVLLFIRGANYGFSNYDDPSYVTNNPSVQAGLSWDSMVWAFTAPTDYWHPLTWLSHMLDWQLFGENAFGHHFTSLLWHAVNAVLVFLILRRLTGADWTSALAAALFAWHPLRAESVVWITERKDVMSGFFFLVTVWAYASYVARREAGRPAKGFYALSLGWFVCGLMSKPMIVTVPAVLLVLDFWPLRRVSLDRDAWRRWSALLLEKVPFFALSAVTAFATVKMQHHAGAFVLELPFVARLSNAVVSIPRYTGKFFWPVDLTVFYPHPGHWPALIVAGAAAFVLGVTVLAWRQRREFPWILAGWLSFGIMLLPAIGIIQVGAQSMADRYTYLPILGLQIALLWTLRVFAARMPRSILSITAGAALLACVGRTWDQQATWRDPVTLFQHSIAITEKNEIGHALLGYTFLNLDRLEEARRHAGRALQFNPRNHTALFTLASIDERQERFADAIAGYRAVLRERTGDSQSSLHLGVLLLRSGDVNEAKEHIAGAIRSDPELHQAFLALALVEYQQGQAGNALHYFEAALAARKDDADALYGAGLALNKLGRSREAREHLEAAIGARPSHPEAHTELGLLLLDQGNAEAAATQFRAAIQIEPRFVVARIGLGRAAEKLGLTAEATASFEAALTLAPNDARSHRTWADTLARRSQFADATRHYERAAELDPQSAETRAALGFVLFVSGRREEAIASWKEALRLDPNFPGLRERLQRLP
ncbi:MAG TPA: tetratricopeptide repeat protein [Opitutus sp.]|nr:tetratricopeptide repeat protein [Opitutus sp.]